VPVISFPVSQNRSINIIDNPIYLRNEISRLEDFLKQFAQVEVGVQHHFSKGVYAREMPLAKGTLVVGKIHKYQNLNILSKGEVSVLSVDGVMRVKAPHTFVASPGSKRVIFAHEDTIWTTIHGTSEKDVDKIEKQFIAETYEEVYLAGDRGFQDALQAIGTTEAETKNVSENEDDLIPFPYGTVGVEILVSDIHGNGVFATRSFKKDQVIAAARISGKRTPAAKYSNHSANPNGKMATRENGDVDLVALSDILVDGKPIEIVTDYYFNFVSTRGR
jgi:hypothetical protein